MVDFERLRRLMVDNQLRTSNVTDRRVLAAMLEVPREEFVPPDRAALAYIDEAQDVGHGRALASPAPFAKLVQLARIDAGDAVLDIGVASGYSTAVLARLAASVVGVESVAALAELAEANMRRLGVGNARVVAGGTDALPAGQTFDVIMIEGAVDEVPPGLFERLAEGGRMVALLRRGPAAVAHVYVRSEGGLNSRPEFNASLPPLATAARTEEFVF